MLIMPNPEKGVRYAIRELNKSIESLKNIEDPYKYEKAALILATTIHNLDLLMETHNLTLSRD